MRLLAARAYHLCVETCHGYAISTLSAPLFLATGLADRTLSPYHQYAAVAALCAAGNPLEWKTYQGITHNGIVNTAFADELTFVQAVLAGKPHQTAVGWLYRARPSPHKDICITTDF
jgi:hypothetical protein